MTKRFLSVGFCALIALGMGSAASAATIAEVMAGAFDPTVYDFYASGYGHTGYYLTWDNVGADNLFGTSAIPKPSPLNAAAANPSWLDFRFVSDTSGGGGGTGGGGSSGGTGPWISNYTLGTNTSGAWSMDFSVLLFDPSFAGTQMIVELLGDATGSDYKTKTVTAADIASGFMSTWHIAGADGEKVTVRVTSYGDESYAAGFFMDNSSVVPEPTTLGLMAIGLVGLVARRRRK